MRQREGKPTVLVVDDRLEMAEMIADGLRDAGYSAVASASSREALVQLEKENFAALITDLRMPEVDGIALLQASRRLNVERPVIVMTAFGAIDSAIDSIRLGAYHYLTKPFKLEELAIFLSRALEETLLRRETAALKATLRERFALQNLVASSPAMSSVLEVMERIADADAPVLFTGETGTGKSLLARVLHAESPRASKPFVAVNVAALPEQLLESELFGHVKGAFTDAVSDRPGLFAEADGGTLFLDEIGEMPAPLQAKLLHVLESKTVRPVGSSKERAVDVRVLTATHRDLRERVRAGAFREDLLYRLDVVPIEIPPLRHRKEDLPALIQHFLAASKQRHPHSKVERFSPDAVRALFEHTWPGNIRELSHVVERMVLLARGEEIARDELPLSVRAPPPGLVSFGGEVTPMREMQRRYAAWAIEQCGGSRTRTAEKLEIDAKTLAKWLSVES